MSADSSGPTSFAVPRSNRPDSRQPGNAGRGPRSQGSGAAPKAPPAGTSGNGAGNSGAKTSPTAGTPASKPVSAQRIMRDRYRERMLPPRTWKQAEQERERQERNRQALSAQSRATYRAAAALAGPQAAARIQAKVSTYPAASSVGPRTAAPTGPKTGLPGPAVPIGPHPATHQATDPAARQAIHQAPNQPPQTPQSHHQAPHQAPHQASHQASHQSTNPVIDSATTPGINRAAQAPALPGPDPVIKAAATRAIVTKAVTPTSPVPGSRPGPGGLSRPNLSVNTYVASPSSSLSSPASGRPPLHRRPSSTSSVVSQAAAMALQKSRERPESEPTSAIARSRRSSTSSVRSISAPDPRPMSASSSQSSLASVLSHSPSVGNPRSGPDPGLNNGQARAGNRIDAGAAARASIAKPIYVAPRVPMSTKFVSSLSQALRREQEQRKASEAKRRKELENFRSAELKVAAAKSMQSRRPERNDRMSEYGLGGESGPANPDPSLLAANGAFDAANSVIHALESNSYMPSRTSVDSQRSFGSVGTAETMGSSAASEKQQLLRQQKQRNEENNKCNALQAAVTAGTRMEASMASIHMQVNAAVQAAQAKRDRRELMRHYLPAASWSAPSRFLRMRKNNVSTNPSTTNTNLSASTNYAEGNNNNNSMTPGLGTPNSAVVTPNSIAESAAGDYFSPRASHEPTRPSRQHAPENHHERQLTEGPHTAVSVHPNTSQGSVLSQSSSARADPPVPALVLHREPSPPPPPPPPPSNGDGPGSSSTSHPQFSLASEPADRTSNGDPSRPAGPAPGPIAVNNGPHSPVYKATGNSGPAHSGSPQSVHLHSRVNPSASGPHQSGVSQPGSANSGPLPVPHQPVSSESNSIYQPVRQGSPAKPSNRLPHTLRTTARARPSKQTDSAHRTPVHPRPVHHTKIVPMGHDQYGGIDASSLGLGFGRSDEPETPSSVVSFSGPLAIPTSHRHSTGHSGGQDSNPSSVGSTDSEFMVPRSGLHPPMPHGAYSHSFSSSHSSLGSSLPPGTPTLQRLPLTLRDDGRRKRFNEDKPWKGHKSQTDLTERERKRYESLWAANRGTFLPYLAVPEQYQTAWEEAVAVYFQQQQQQQHHHQQNTQSGVSSNKGERPLSQATLAPSFSHRSTRSVGSVNTNYSIGSNDGKVLDSDGDADKSSRKQQPDRDAQDREQQAKHAEEIERQAMAQLERQAEQAGLIADSEGPNKGPLEKQIEKNEVLDTVPELEPIEGSRRDGQDSRSEYSDTRSEVESVYSVDSEGDDCDDPLAEVAKRANDVHGYAVARLWRRSRLPEDTLQQIWDLVDTNKDGTLDRSGFVIGMWLCDQCLYGRKLPPKITPELWQSAGKLNLKIRVKPRKTKISRLRKLPNFLGKTVGFTMHSGRQAVKKAVQTATS